MKQGGGRCFPGKARMYSKYWSAPDRKDWRQTGERERERENVEMRLLMYVL